MRGKTAARASLYPRDASTNIDKWLVDVQREADAPNAEQMAILNTVAQRLKAEMAEELTDSKAESAREPLFDMVHGLPGQCAVAGGPCYTNKKAKNGSKPRDPGLPGVPPPATPREAARQHPLLPLSTVMGTLRTHK